MHQLTSVVREVGRAVACLETCWWLQVPLQSYIGRSGFVSLHISLPGIQRWWTWREERSGQGKRVRTTSAVGPLLLLAMHNLSIYTVSELVGSLFRRHGGGGGGSFHGSWNKDRDTRGPGGGASHQPPYQPPPNPAVSEAMW